MSVYEEILAWSQDRPAWQRDALRRLVHRDELGHDEIMALVDLCEAEYVRLEEADFHPIGSDDLRPAASGGAAVTLHAIRGVENVAALEGDLEFSPVGVTLVCGPNGTGKSAYARILKKFCRARGADDALRGNVFRASSIPPSATLHYAVAGGQYRSTWREGAVPPEQLAAVSVFDETAIASYVGGKLNVAYQPAGLDLLPRLAAACDAVRDELVRRQQRLTDAEPAYPSVHPSTEAAAFLGGITAKTKPVDIEAACTFDAAAQARKKEVSQRLVELEAPERKAQAKALREQAERLSTVAQRLDGIAGALSDEVEAKLRGARQRADALGSAALAEAADAFASYPVQPVGTVLWRALLESAAAYFEREVAPGKAFGDGEHCVLCHQELSPEARARLGDFRAFVSRQMQAASAGADVEIARATSKLDALDVRGELFDVVCRELDDAELSRLVTGYLDAADARRAALTRLAAGSADDAPPLGVPPSAALRTRADTVRKHAAELGQSPDDEEIAGLQRELDELRAREALAVGAEAIKQRHKALVRAAKYDKAIKSAKTNVVTKWNGELTRAAVTDALVRAFAREVSRFGIGPAVALTEGGRKKGEQLHTLAVSGAVTATSPASIASSGEAQLIALANFFTELETASAKSAMVLDDPASHLDADNASAVARRLAEAGSERQVIVFTHDAAFGGELERACVERSVALLRRDLRR